MAPLTPAKDQKDFEPVIYKVDLTDSKRWIDVEEIIKTVLGWQYWYPQFAGVELVDLKAIRYKVQKKWQRKLTKLALM